MNDSSPETVTNPSLLWRFRFGTAEFDEAQFELRVAGLAVDVQRKPLEILRLLLSHAGEVVTKEELLETVWESRPTVENVIANAMSKLRDALGEENAKQIATQPRVGYRFVGPVERVAVGRSLSSRMELKADEPVPGRPNFQLKSLLGTSKNNEVWIARHVKTRALRVYKFALTGERLGALKREATLSRFIHETWGDRDDFVRMLDWNFETPPFFLECEHGGENLSEWAGKDDRLQKLGLSERLELFLQIAAAVAAAHQIGVLHKDLKPGNILVAPKSETLWQIRLTDFGSGRLLDPERLEELGITRHGMTVTTGVGENDTGTFAYLAPEVIARQTPTVKSDIYALGIILYQLVVGDLRKPMVSGWERRIEHELLREDIGAATDGDPQHRLSSVEELIERVTQLDARVTQREQARAAERKSAALAEALKRSRTRRPWVMTAIAALALGIVAGGFFYYRLHVSQMELARQNNVVLLLNKFLIEDFIGAANPANVGRADLTVVEAARTAARRIDTQFGGSGLEVRAALHEAMQGALYALTDFSSANDEARKALAAYERMRPPDPQKLRNLRLQLAAGLTNHDDFAEARKLLTQLEMESVRSHPDLEFQVSLLIARAAFYTNGDGSIQQGIAALEKARVLAAGLPGSTLREQVALNLAMDYDRLGDSAAAEKQLRELIPMQISAHGETSIEVGRSRGILGEMITTRKPDEALIVLNEALRDLSAVLSEDHRDVLATRNAIASVYYQQRKFAQAASEWQRSFGAATASQPVNRRHAIIAEMNWAKTTQRLGDTAQAAQLARDALQRARAYLAEKTPVVQAARYWLAKFLLDLKSNPQEAARLIDGLSADTLKFLETLRDMESWLGYQRGRVMLQTGRPREALAELEKSLQSIEDKEPDPDVDGAELEPSLRTALREAQTALHSK